MEELWDAVYNQNIKRAKYLLENKADPEYTPEYQRSPLQLAASTGNIKMMEILLGYGANINSTNTPEGKSALTRAVIEGGFDAVVFLVKHKADVNTKCSYGTTPLRAALWNGRVSIARYLLKNGANATDQIINFVKDITVGSHLVVGFLHSQFPNEIETFVKKNPRGRGLCKGYLWVGKKYHICYESLILFCLWFNKTYMVKDLSKIISKKVWACVPNKW